MKYCTDRFLVQLMSNMDNQAHPSGSSRLSSTYISCTLNRSMTEISFLISNTLSATLALPKSKGERRKRLKLAGEMSGLISFLLHPIHEDGRWCRPLRRRHGVGGLRRCIQAISHFGRRAAGCGLCGGHRAARLEPVVATARLDAPQRCSPRPWMWPRPPLHVVHADRQ